MVEIAEPPVEAARQLEGVPSKPEVNVELQEHKAICLQRAESLIELINILEGRVTGLQQLLAKHLGGDSNV